MQKCLSQAYAKPRWDRPSTRPQLLLEPHGFSTLSRWLSVSICAPSVTPCKSSNKTAAFAIRKLKALLVEITDCSGSCTSISADADLVPWEGKHEEESLHWCTGPGRPGACAHPGEPRRNEDCPSRRVSCPQLRFVKYARQ